jgi:ABC-2 type transport system permease protein
MMDAKKNEDLMPSDRPVIPTPPHPVTPSRWRAWLYLIRLSFQRQARAHLMLWIALGLLAFTAFVVFVNTQAGRWSMSHWTFPRRVGPTFAQHLFHYELVGHLPLDPIAGGVQQATWASLRTVLYEASGFFVFSNWIVFSIFATFLLPMWSLSFATEGVGREREGRNLIWLLSRPISRPAIYLGKFVALLPWCLLLNLGGFWLICRTAGTPGRLAFQVYWPAVLWGTLALASLFHLMGAWFRRPAVVAILYSFFLETIMGNLPGHFKRTSISFYTRCLMFDHAHDWGIHPERPGIFLPVSGSTALAVLAGVTVVCLAIGTYVFSRGEYLDLS